MTCGRAVAARGVVHYAPAAAAGADRAADERMAQVAAGTGTSKPCLFLLLFFVSGRVAVVVAAPAGVVVVSVG